MAKPDVLAIASPGSRPMKWAKHESYCRLRASLMPRVQAFREAGWNTSDDDNAYTDACRLERRPGIKDRIEYLSKQQVEELIPAKRRRIEEALWNIHDADIGALWETYEVANTGNDGKLATDQDGKMLTVRKQRPKLLSDLPPDVRKQIEDVTVDRNGNVIPKLYSRLQASKELRQMHGFGRTDDRPDDVSRLSDAELVAQLADTAKELGIQIDLNYKFAQQAPDAETAGDDAQVIDSAPAADPDPMTPAEAQAARELKIGATPAGARRLNKTARNGKR
jgi:hypothetical protein